MIEVSLFLGHVRRLLLRPRAWFAAGGILVYTSINVYRLRSGYAQGTQDQEVWWYVLDVATYHLAFVFPLLIVGAVGTSVAEDRRSGFSALVTIRSTHPLGSFLTQCGASLVSAAGVTAVPLAIDGCFARIVAPQVVTGFFSSVQSGFPSFPRSPLLLMVLPASVYVAVAVLSVALAALVGLFTTNPFAVVGLTGLLLLLPRRILPEAASNVLDPNFILGGGAAPVTTFVVAATATLAVVALTSAIVIRRGTP